MSSAPERADQTIEDSFTTLISFQDGSTATIIYSASGAPDLPKEPIEIICQGMTISIDDFRTTRFHGGDVDKIAGPQSKGFSEEIAAFVNAVKTGAPSPIPFDELISATRTTFAIKESLHTGKPVHIQS